MDEEDLGEQHLPGSGINVADPTQGWNQQTLTTVQSKAGLTGRQILDNMLQNSERGKSGAVVFEDSESDESEDEN